MKELKRFHLKGNTIGFYPRTQKLELHRDTKCIVPCESTTAEEASFEWSLHKIPFTCRKARISQCVQKEF